MQTQQEYQDNPADRRARKRNDTEFPRLLVTGFCECIPEDFPEGLLPILQDHLATKTAEEKETGKNETNELKRFGLPCSSKVGLQTRIRIGIIKKFQRALPEILKYTENIRWRESS